MNLATARLPMSEAYLWVPGLTPRRPSTSMGNGRPRSRNCSGRSRGIGPQCWCSPRRSHPSRRPRRPTPCVGEGPCVGRAGLGEPVRHGMGHGRPRILDALACRGPVHDERRQPVRLPPARGRPRAGEFDHAQARRAHGRRPAAAVPSRRRCESLLWPGSGATPARCCRRRVAIVADALISAEPQPRDRHSLDDPSDRIDPVLIVDVARDRRAARPVCRWHHRRAHLLGTRDWRWWHTGRP